MKKHLPILLAPLLTFSTVKAQLSFGIKAGGALTSLPGVIGSNDNKTGFYAGLSAATQLRKTLSLQAELYYSAQGNKQTLIWTDISGGGGTEEKTANRLNYINLPLLVKYQPACGVFVETGFQAGLLVSARLKSSRASSDIKNNYRSFDFSWPIGAGYQFKNGLGVNLRYNLGLLNIYYTGMVKPHNSVMQAGLFYAWKKR